jgi:large subunit ribosomal protein L29
MKAAQIRELTSEELTRQLEDDRREAFNLRMQQQTGQLENTGRILLVRREIARLETEKTARARR